jgi:uncharacterized protein YdiU (UPF0061 family)
MACLHVSVAGNALTEALHTIADHLKTICVPMFLCVSPSLQERQALQASVSPKFVPRQHLLQYAIEAAEKGDMSEVNKLLEVRGRTRGWR